MDSLPFSCGILPHYFPGREEGKEGEGGGGLRGELDERRSGFLEELKGFREFVDIHWNSIRDLEFLPSV